MLGISLLPSRASDVADFEPLEGFGKDAAYRLTSSHRALWVFRMADAATHELATGIEEAEEEGVKPCPEAVEAARLQIRDLAARLSAEAPEGRTPVLSVVVNGRGEIEIVGYYLGTVGRYTIRIGRQAEFVDLSATHLLKR